MLGNVQDTLDHYKWYQDAYPDDLGYALNFLCSAITLYRYGDIEEAEEKLISTVLSNVFLIGFILGHKIPTLDSWEDRYYNELMEIEYFPHELLEFITGEEKEWIEASYKSSRTTAIRKAYIEIDDQLQSLPRGEKRTELCHDLYRIRALDFSGVDFTKSVSDQGSGNSTT